MFLYPGGAEASLNNTPNTNIFLSVICDCVVTERDASPDFSQVNTAVPTGKVNVVYFSQESIVRDSRILWS